MMAPATLPPGVKVEKLNPKALALAAAVLNAVKESKTIVTQMLQDTVNVPEHRENGIRDVKELPMADHYKQVQAYEQRRQQLLSSAAAAGAGGNAGAGAGARKPGGGELQRALYMQNKALVEVVDTGLVKQLYGATPFLRQDVLVNYPRLYQSDNPRASNDVLVGGTHSWSPVHQDLPLYCTSLILVLEGHKQFVLLAEDTVPALRVNTAGGDWEKPVTWQGVMYPNLETFVDATGGVVVNLRAGDVLLMAPRIFHLARNCEFTTSCNFSVCAMPSVPLAVSQTFNSIRPHSKDPSYMLFDEDFARLLKDCTEALAGHLAAMSELSERSLAAKTRNGRLPTVNLIMECTAVYNLWYMTLRIIPNGWVTGFNEPMRDQLLSRLEQALPVRRNNAIPKSTRRHRADEQQAEPEPAAAEAEAAAAGGAASSEGHAQGQSSSENGAGVAAAGAKAKAGRGAVARRGITGTTARAAKRNAMAASIVARAAGKLKQRRGSPAAAAAAVGGGSDGSSDTPAFWEHVRHDT